MELHLAVCRKYANRGRLRDPERMDRAESVLLLVVEQSNFGVQVKVSCELAASSESIAFDHVHLQHTLVEHASEFLSALTSSHLGRARAARCVMTDV